MGIARLYSDSQRERALLPRAWRTTLPCAMRACIPARKRAGLALVERSRPNHVARSCFRRERPSRAGGAQQPQPQLRRSSSAVSARETRAARASSLCAGSRALPARGSHAIPAYKSHALPARASCTPLNAEVAHFPLAGVSRK